MTFYTCYIFVHDITVVCEKSACDMLQGEGYKIYRNCAKYPIVFFYNKNIFKQTRCHVAVQCLPKDWYLDEYKLQDSFDLSWVDIIAPVYTI